MNSDQGRRDREDADGLRRRRAALRELLDHVARRRDPTIAWAGVPGLGAAFLDDDDVLRDLGGQWSRALAGQVDAVLDEHDDLTDVIEDAAARLAAARPALHAVLAAYADRTVVRAAARRDASRLGVPDARAHAAHVAPRFVSRGGARVVDTPGHGGAPGAGRRVCRRALRLALHRPRAGTGRRSITSRCALRSREGR